MNAASVGGFFRDFLVISGPRETILGNPVVDALSKENENPADFEGLLERFRPEIRDYLLSLTASLSAAEDLAQETAVILWRKRAEFDPAGNFRAWAFRIAFYQAQNHRRKEARRVGMEFPLDATFERLAEYPRAAAAASAPRREAMVHCLGRLPEDDRELLLRRLQDGVSLEQLSSEVGMTRNAMAQKIFRIKSALLACIRRRVPA
jgi:RNA polymerase sigma-70 factor (ECF subfamily)